MKTTRLHKTERFEETLDIYFQYLYLDPFTFSIWIGTTGVMENLAVFLPGPHPDSSSAIIHGGTDMQGSGSSLARRLALKYQKVFFCQLQHPPPAPDTFPLQVY